MWCLSASPDHPPDLTGNSPLLQVMQEKIFPPGIPWWPGWFFGRISGQYPLQQNIMSGVTSDKIRVHPPVAGWSLATWMHLPQMCLRGGDRRLRLSLECGWNWWFPATGGCTPSLVAVENYVLKNKIQNTTRAKHQKTIKMKFQQKISRVNIIFLIAVAAIIKPIRNEIS